MCDTVFSFHFNLIFFYSHILLLLLIICCCFCSNEADVITNLDDIYNIGMFVQITEFQEFNNRMRLIIQGHRR